MLPAALGFLAGVSVCVLLAIMVLPAVVRSQCADTVRLYHEFLRPQTTSPVIVIERDGESVRPAAASRSGRRVRLPTRTGAAVDSRHGVDAPRTVLNSAAGNPEQCTEEASMLQRVYEQNAQLREQLARHTKPADGEAGRPKLRRIDSQKTRGQTDQETRE
jgi:hypothetical protein